MMKSTMQTGCGIKVMISVEARSAPRKLEEKERTNFPKIRMFNLSRDIRYVDRKS